MTSQPTPPRHHAPGGWRRAVVGLLIGLGFGALVTRVVPPERSPQAWRGLGRGERE